MMRLWSKLMKRFASSTFNNQTHIWMRFCRITYSGNLQSFISEIRQCLNGVISVKVETIHYCRDGKHKPLAGHSAERCWQLHPGLSPEKFRKEARVNLTIAQALMTTLNTRKNSTQTLIIVLDTGAINHMFNDRHFFLELKRGNNVPISSFCDNSTLSAAGTGTAKLMDRNGTIWSLKYCLYIL
ncbi:hypothetical protein O181_018828 [Austropuccinia psidii MF-1]|uniref:Retrovirus-related Pol polyprotein from transposon TNT 1-94-like beta-barrel domain-containing protein n=1 Tax=Austropuccinia psidii MF-1 TaxID=1389203 RepID=A0A9Q3C9T7_9BASI|nr:hypothetical protein [Austropuccinia psidii MF-1]